MMITLRQLEVLVAIAKQQNMSKAAESLYLTQSACSMALSNLERQLQGTLFNRVGKRLLLNECGRILLPRATNILSQVKELQDLMRDAQETSPAGHLLIGASSTVGNYVLPRVISKFLAAYPRSKISLKVSNTEHVIRQILNFEVDIGFIEGNCYTPELEVKPWRQDKLIIIAAPQHPLSKKNKLSLHDLKTADWILREKGSGTRSRFEAAMHAEIVPFLELSHTEAIKNAVETGIGIGCVSEITVTEALKSKRLLELKAPFLKLTRNFYMLLHKEKYQTAVLRAFIRQCE